MANQVFANTREIACKAADGKSICAFPDVCMTPPENPATPPGVPIPYPNTGLASDTSNGSTSVKISGKEVMLKNKSYFKRSMGDEAGCAAKKGVITSKNMGKVYFNAWSMDVKFEGQNVPRMLDLTTHNHASVPGNTPVWPYLDEIAVDAGGGGGNEAGAKCEGDKAKEEKACEGFKPYGDKDPCSKAILGTDKKPSRSLSSNEANKLADRTAGNKCLAARRCALQPYKSAKSSCCHPQTGHHLIEASSLHAVGRGGKDSVAVAGVKDYSENMAPCVCAEGATQNVGTHGLMHTFQSAGAAKCESGEIPLSNGKSVTAKKTTYKEARDSAIECMQKVFPESACDKECLAAQLDAYHKQCGIEEKTVIKAVETGQTDLTAAEQALKDRSARLKAAKASRPAR